MCNVIDVPIGSKFKVKATEVAEIYTGDGVYKDAIFWNLRP